MRRPLLVAPLALCLLATRVPAQIASGPGQPAQNYADRFQELVDLDPDPALVGEVRGLTLKRDVATLALQDGTLQLFRPIGGQVMVAAFQGHGSLALTPPSVIEQERLRLVRKSPSVQEPFQTALFLFTDSTLAELTRQVTFRPGKNDDWAGPILKDCLGLLGNGAAAASSSGRPADRSAGSRCGRRRGGGAAPQRAYRPACPPPEHVEAAPRPIPDSSTPAYDSDNRYGSAGPGEAAYESDLPACLHRLAR